MKTIIIFIVSFVSDIFPKTNIYYEIHIHINIRFITDFVSNIFPKTIVYYETHTYNENKEVYC